MSKVKHLETMILDRRYGSLWPMPQHETSGSAGVDLRAALHEGVTIGPGERALIPTGLAINISAPGLAGVTVARSGLALNRGIRVVQGAAIIDSDYTGEIKLPMINDGDEPFTIKPGDRFAQILLMSVQQFQVMPVYEFSTATERGGGGFGHTGTE